MKQPRSTTLPKSETLETPYMTLWMDGEVLCARFVDDLHVSLEVAKACVESRIFFSKGKPHAVLVDLRPVKSTTSSARKYMATMGATLVTIGAIIVDSSFSRTIGNLFLKVDRPLVPARLFTNEQKALEWLRNSTHVPGPERPQRRAML